MHLYGSLYLHAISVAVLIIIFAALFEVPYTHNSAEQIAELRSDQDNWNGTVLINPKLTKFIEANTNVTIFDAIQSALNNVGNNSSAQEGSLLIINGFLVYRVNIVDSNGIIHRVIVDAGNGKILSNTTPGQY